MFWEIGDEEPDDPRFVTAGPGACGLYFMAGASCMRRVRYRPEFEIPGEWFISDQWVKGWPNGTRLANRLVDVDLWVRVPGGYQYVWIQPRNTAAAVRAQRKRQAAKKRNQREAMSPGDIPPCPPGTYKGDMAPESRPLKKRSRSARDSSEAS
jgi:hypothetical protein